MINDTLSFISRINDKWYIIFELIGLGWDERRKERMSDCYDERDEW